MKLVTAIIKPFKVDEVRDALAALGVKGVTLTEVKGFGRQKGHTELYRGGEYVVDFLPKSRLDIAVGENQVSAVLDAIERDPCGVLTVRPAVPRWKKTLWVLELAFRRFPPLRIFSV